MGWGAALDARGGTGALQLLQPSFSVPSRLLPSRAPTSLPALLPRSDSELVRRLQPEIERFGGALKWVHRLEPLFAFIPINKVGGRWEAH